MSEPLTPEENAQLLHLLQDNSNNIRHAKTQQWQTGYYSLLAYGALVSAVYTKPPISPWNCLFVSVSLLATFIVLVLGVLGVCELKDWMERLNDSSSKTEEFLSCEYKRFARYDSKKRYFHFWMINLAIIIGGVITLSMISARLSTL